MELGGPVFWAGVFLASLGVGIFTYLALSYHERRRYADGCGGQMRARRVRGIPHGAVYRSRNSRPGQSSGMAHLDR